MDACSGKGRASQIEKCPHKFQQLPGLPTHTNSTPRVTKSAVIQTVVAFNCKLVPSQISNCRVTVLLCQHAAAPRMQRVVSADSGRRLRLWCVYIVPNRHTPALFPPVPFVTLRTCAEYAPHKYFNRRDIASASRAGVAAATTSRRTSTCPTLLLPCSETVHPHSQDIDVPSRRSPAAAASPSDCRGR